MPYFRRQFSIEKKTQEMYSEWIQNKTSRDRRIVEGKDEFIRMSEDSFEKINVGKFHAVLFT